MGSESSVPAARSCDKEPKQAAKKHEPGNSETNLPGTNISEPKSKRRKTIKPKAVTESPSKHEPNSPSSRAPQGQGTQQTVDHLRDKHFQPQMREKGGRNGKKDSTTETPTRRSHRKKAGGPEAGPTTPLVKSVNKYGFEVWVPATGSNSLTASQSAKEETAKLPSLQEDDISDDVSVEPASDAAVAGSRNETSKDAIFQKHTGYDTRQKSVSDAVRGDVNEETMAMEDVVDTNFILERLKTYNAQTPSNKDRGAQDAIDLERQPIPEQDVQMMDVDDARVNVTTSGLGRDDTYFQVNHHASPGSKPEKEVVAAEVDSPLRDNRDVGRTTPGPLHWRAADKRTETGVHFFNIPFEDLREMTRLQALERARPQSSDELRALLVSANTSSESSPEEYTLADARVRLQACRNALYGVRLRERMATMRMAAARATQQPRDSVAQLEVITEEARKELLAAQDAFDEDFRNVAVAEQALKNVTGKPVPDLQDPETEADALRREKMVNEINGAIAEYEAQVKA
ncbi:uncharacterized protein J4E88_007102 [Alternaria novae-zelandiae]|uniref:uncharacterized protein n=1 Tax=Alternaria novae-zelandiae TaxID=430562 RepID=UPI0020C34C84|nr:uncharacterized protein J4E88_007102 [Alternaria novae-zelandiae]KAI4677294.1 hypothetical protein J4E88_007102 [Alternaria novae-zelandiae]